MRSGRFISIIVAGSALIACVNDEHDTREIIDNLIQAGFVTDDITTVDGVVYVGRDAEVSLAASREMLQTGNSSKEHYRTSNRISTSLSKICIDGTTFTGVFSTALDLAIQNYEELPLRFAMARRPSPGCSFTIRAVIQPALVGGSAGFPSGDLPFGTITIGGGLATLGVDTIEHVITHEIGHTIGFRHSDFFDTSISCSPGGNEGDGGVGAIHIPGTPTGAVVGGSIMNSCFRTVETGEFTGTDLVALRALYGSGTDDLVWQHDNGQVHYWSLASGQPTSFINIHTPVGPEWHLRGVGDVDRSGTEDLVWQHDNGQVLYWSLASGQPTGFINIHTPVAPEWHLRGAGDANGDGTDDLVWQHDNGQVHYWSLTNGQPTGFINIHTPVGPEWHLRGVGDVDGSGTDDVVWQHDNGQVNYWSLANGQPTSFINIHTPVGSEWHLRGVGDVDGSGTDDLVWQHDNGQVLYWRLVSGQPTGFINIHTPVTPEWHLRGVGNVDRN